MKARATTPPAPREEPQPLRAMRKQKRRIDAWRENGDAKAFKSEENVVCSFYAHEVADVVAHVDTLRADLATARGERDAVVRAIDEEMVNAHIGVFNVVDDPKIALNKLGAWHWQAGEYFAKERTPDAQAVSDMDVPPRHPVLGDPIGYVAPPGGIPYKHFVRSREPRDHEVGHLLFAVAPNIDAPAVSEAAIYAVIIRCEAVGSTIQEDWRATAAKEVSALAARGGA